MSEYIKSLNLFPIPVYISILRPNFFSLGVTIQSKYIELSLGWRAIGFLYNPWWLDV